MILCLKSKQEEHEWKYDDVTDGSVPAGAAFTCLHFSHTKQNTLIRPCKRPNWETLHDGKF